jgi:dTDP-4-amino-4,6-dideoxygalactose transaminase
LTDRAEHAGAIASDRYWPNGDLGPCSFNRHDVTKTGEAALVLEDDQIVAARLACLRAPGHKHANQGGENDPYSEHCNPRFSSHWPKNSKG